MMAAVPQLVGDTQFRGKARFSRKLTVLEARQVPIQLEIVRIKLK
jgi:hypothetical protein